MKIPAHPHKKQRTHFLLSGFFRGGSLAGRGGKLGVPGGGGGRLTSGSLFGCEGAGFFCSCGVVGRPGACACASNSVNPCPPSKEERGASASIGLAMPSAGTAHNATTAVSANSLFTFSPYFLRPARMAQQSKTWGALQHAGPSRRLLASYFLGGGGGSTIFILGGGGLNSDVGTPTILGFGPGVARGG